MKVILLTAILFISLLQLTCKEDSPVTVIPPTGQDTTSHYFAFTSYTFGNGSSNSYLNDVVVIDENNIWAVGEINVADTSEKGYSTFNAVNWNGKEWKLKKIMFYTFCNQSYKHPYPASSIAAFSDKDIWISSGSQITHFDSEDQLSIECIPASVSKIWGRNSDDFYVVGNNGNIAYYNGTSWQKINSGTSVDLQDVWGSSDGKSIWIAGFNYSIGTIFLRNSGKGFEKILEITEPDMPHPENQITHVFKSLWAANADTVYLGAIGRIYAAPKNTEGYAKENIWWNYSNSGELPPETNAIRGNAPNDIFVCGYLKFLMHWNGKSWNRYKEIEGAGNWKALAVKKNVIAVVGYNNSFPLTATIVIGKRNSNY